jgi:hypothetical protein
VSRLLSLQSEHVAYLTVLAVEMNRKFLGSEWIYCTVDPRDEMAYLSTIKNDNAYMV